MKEKRLLAVHGIFVSPKMRQKVFRKIIQKQQGLFPTDRISKIVFFYPADGLHPCFLEHLQQIVHLMSKALGWRNRHLAFVLFAVEGIKIPLPAQRLFGGIHQQLVLFAHVAVEILHQVLLFPFEEKL